MSHSAVAWVPARCPIRLPAAASFLRILAGSRPTVAPASEPVVSSLTLAAPVVVARRATRTLQAS
jgi:hypothetical protein